MHALAALIAIPAHTHMLSLPLCSSNMRQSWTVRVRVSVCLSV